MLVSRTIMQHRDLIGNDAFQTNLSTQGLQRVTQRAVCGRRLFNLRPKLSIAQRVGNTRRHAALEVRIHDGAEAPSLGVAQETS